MEILLLSDVSDEVVIGLLGLVFILGLASLAIWIFFWGGDMIEAAARRRRFPVVVPGWGTRLSGPLPFRGELSDIARMNELLLKHAVANGYDQSGARNKLNSIHVQWVEADPALGKRAVFDPYHRRVPALDAAGAPMVNVEGKPITNPMLVAGWHVGDTLHVVYLSGDTVEDTAYAHEMGHALHVLKWNSAVDYDHKDYVMWERIVDASRDEMRRERGAAEKVPLDVGSDTVA